MHFTAEKSSTHLKLPDKIVGSSSERAWLTEFKNVNWPNVWSEVEHWWRLNIRNSGAMVEVIRPSPQHVREKTYTLTKSPQN
jgi:hypothetical protein